MDDPDTLDPDTTNKKDSNMNYLQAVEKDADDRKIRDDALKLIISVLNIYDGFDCLCSSDLHWRTDDEYAPVSIFTTCSDLFDWGTADCERITLENLPILEQSIKEVKDIIGSNLYADLLFCCRVRKMRPQTPYYQELDERLHHLFDACGPAR